MSRKFNSFEKESNGMCVSILNDWMGRYSGRKKKKRERRNGKIRVKKNEEIEVIRFSANDFFNGFIKKKYISQF